MENKKHSPAFQFYPQDFLVGCADLSAEEVGGYIRLLCYQWTKGSIPNDNKKLMQMSGVFGLTELECIKQKFVRIENGNLVNLKLESVRQSQDEYRQKQSERASKRWESQRNAKALPTDMPQPMPNVCSSSSSSTSSLSSTSTSSSKDISEVKKSKRFIPPTTKEVFEYCQIRKNNVDAQRFVDYYTANGWVAGKVKMKDWKAAVRTWEKNNFNTNNNGTTTNKSFEQRADDFTARILGTHPTQGSESNNPDSNIEEADYSLFDE
jgi:uncharacterized protein YdaU (DUF1376 family)